jgi:NAD(P)-dependent dehydrogenase (short-subunit alcohol dehydrogenase family)
MEISDRTVVVTGAASGIGRALALRLADVGAAHVVVADLDAAGARAVAAEVGRRGAVGVARRVDVTAEREVAALVDDVEREVAPVDLCCSNAGILVVGGVEVPDGEWRRILDVNLLAHVHLARHLVPRMLERGGGYLLNTASAAGLLTQIGSAPYAVTKHAAVAFAEWLAITYGERGLKVSVLCPQAVDTPMIAGTVEGGVAGVDGVLDPEAVAEVAVDGLADERFLILPHPEVADYLRRKGDDPDRWIAGMRRLQRRFTPGP